MSLRSSDPARRPVLIARCLLLACVAIAVLCVATARASVYKMVVCAAGNGAGNISTATNTINAQHPGGIFDYDNYCTSPSDPAGDAGYLRISEHEAEGYAGQGAYGDIYWDAPAFTHFMAAGGYTREAYVFNEGWRARFWAIDPAGNGFQIFTQGAGLPNTGDQWGTTSIFASHLWPYGNFGNFWRFVYELECVRPGGCNRIFFNAVEANSFVFIVSDDAAPEVGFVDTDGPFLSGQWTRGAKAISWNSHDLGSGLRFERLRVCERTSLTPT